MNQCGSARRSTRRVYRRHTSTGKRCSGLTEVSSGPVGKRETAFLRIHAMEKSPCSAIVLSFVRELTLLGLPTEFSLPSSGVCKATFSQEEDCSVLTLRFPKSPCKTTAETGGDMGA